MFPTSSILPDENDLPHTLHRSLHPLLPVSPIPVTSSRTT
ncbi:hypothetical protein MJO28_001237 [Puccinia striiformis f. sp. tritici]|uniref:Uncharacterized protein n=1 Tax=Puccinia striiformis f. sp. tritici TaxID=168172 RepID=A0ACC0F2S1_9BASI|nr:hypothetical protein MJO28_001237 [Puccinia striiformis f. sp. tritici]KAI7966731.1 hypothetical protein MJO29_000008 [Puccinia striiformis f. sp. tritici]